MPRADRIDQHLAHKVLRREFGEFQGEWHFHQQFDADIGQRLRLAGG